MLSLEPEIEREYLRFQDLLPVHFPLGESKIFLNSHDVLRAHFLIANHFYLEGQGLGGIGPKSVDLLESAVWRQHVSYGNKKKWENIFDVSATLFFGLIKNHPFYDANKRTALLSVLYQLYRAGWCPTINEQKIEDFTVDIAENNLSRYARYREYLRNREDDPEVKFISWFFKSNTRKVDNIPRAVTFRELQVILRRHGFDLDSPHGNYINVVRKSVKIRRRTVLGFPIGAEERCETMEKIGQIGFPRWTVQVNAQALKSVRTMTRLHAKDGVDSGAFFRGLDPIQSLITTYNTPLMRLADR